MSNGRTLAPQRPELVTDGPAAPRPRWFEMAMSSDHKDVGRIYIASSLAFLMLGIVCFLLIRLQLGVPENNLIEPVTFNRLLSVGSATLVVLFALPLAFGLYTYVVPLQIGARSLAFPRLSALSVWLYVLGGGLLYVSFVYTPPEAGFNSWPPLSDTAFIGNNGVDVWIVAVGLAVLGIVLQSINLAVTIARMRAPGLAWRPGRRRGQGGRLRRRPPLCPRPRARRGPRGPPQVQSRGTGGDDGRRRPRARQRRRFAQPQGQ